MKIEKHSELYHAIESAIYCIFDGQIELNDPTETLKEFIEVINDNL